MASLLNFISYSGICWEKKLLLALKDSYLEGELPKSLKRGIISI